ncbi:MAG: ABC transporter substrate-binding protein [Candidatus Methanoplasma sp.]|jgi:iron complex transport system substrate-binding protein|nr:ABC transporter substrate-binding protein [Candidatus Methanoplasma sp.]
MNNKGSMKVLALAAVAVIAIAGIGAAAFAINDDGPGGKTITDMRGREVALPDSIDSVIGVKSCSLELISFFEAVDKVKYLDVNESFTDSRTHTFVLEDRLISLPRVDPNDAEQIIQADPDIILSSTVDVSRLNEEQKKYGIPVFAINADLEFGAEYDSQIRTLGKLFGEEERAEDIVSGIGAFISGIRDSLSPPSSGTPAGGFTTAYACGMNFYGAGGFTKTSGDYLPFTYSYVQNVSPSSIAGVGKQPYNTDVATVINYDPQYIFIDGGGLDGTLEYIRGNMPLLGSIDAIRDGNVYSTMVYKDWGTNWLNQLVNVYYVAKIMHPDEFLWDFEDKANEIIQLFYPGTTVSYADIASAQSGNGCSKVTL